MPDSSASNRMWSRVIAAILGFTKKRMRKMYLLSLLIGVLGLLSLIYRWLFPYHRILAAGLIIISLLPDLFMAAAYLNAKGRLKLITEFLLRHKRGLAVSLIVIVSCYLFLVLFPLWKLNFTDMDLPGLISQMDKDQRELTATILSADAAINSLKESGLTNIQIETSSPEKIKELRERYSAIVDHIYVLDSYTEKYRHFYLISFIRHKKVHTEAFIIAYSSFMEKYMLAYELSKMADKNPYFGQLLDEGGTLNLLRTNIVRPKTAIELNSGRAYAQFMRISGPADDYAFLLGRGIDNYDVLFGEFDRSITTGSDAILDHWEQNTMVTWFPLQKTVANSMGDTRFATRDNFISGEQIATVRHMLLPGDILVQRRNWYMSNSGLPGFWTHGAMYVGTLDTLDEYFKDESSALYGMSMSSYLKEKYPDIYEAKSRKFEGVYLETIEAVGEGVIMEPLELSGHADYLGALRPRLSKEDKLKALLFTFDSYGKPYDFNFDFSSEESYVCTELIYKAYLSHEGKKGLNFSLNTIAGRTLLTANDLVEQYSSGEQLDFVFYLEGDELTKTASFKGIDEFRQSWRRPRNDLAIVIDDRR